MEQVKSQTGESLAIVGMSCTLAGGVDAPIKLWQTLINKEIKQSSRIPESRFNIDAYFHENAFGRPSAIGSRGGYFLETELNAFDASFFGYEADEAKHMDPQHFRVLESVYECLESAGRTIEDMKGTKTAVYIGNFSLDQVIKSSRNSYDDRHLHEVIGVDPGLLSSRVSYCFDLKGPVFTTNTGCTSSLFALHTAAMALRSGECSSAIVGGVNLLQGPEAYSSYSKFGIMSPDSKCHSFDARCNGYCRAEGVGTLYVKLLSDAIHDNDPIRGVIRSIAVNSNGYVPGMPLFVPNENGLKMSMRSAYAQANLDPYDTAFIEGHGIGMVLGEIAEAYAIGQAMNEPERRNSPMLVGSLKPNFGHQEAASGIFVMIKAAMMTEAGIIPGHTGFQSAHPKTDFNALNIKVQTETISWPEGYSTRRVGLNSYGWSGTNAHIVVENIQTLHPDYTVGQARRSANYDHASKRPFLVTFSAFSDSSLKRNIAKHENAARDYFMADLAYTLNLRRSKFLHRAFTIADDGDNSAFDAASMIFGFTEKNTKPARISIACSNSDIDLRPIAKECIQVFTVFARSIKALDMVLHQLGNDANIERYIVDGDKTPGLSNGLLALLRNTAIQIALIDLLSHMNVTWKLVWKRPGSEIATAYAAGKLSATEAIILPLLADPGIGHLPEIDSSTRAKLHVAIQKLDTNHNDWSQSNSREIIPDVDNIIAESEPDVVILIGPCVDLLGASKAQCLKIDNFRSLLQVAGHLYLLDQPINLDRVNELINVNWKPLTLVDLPPYQWDHSKSYTQEAHANLEHRLNSHAYHDLLGRRVFGLGPHTMVWKNKLSFQDLPSSIPWIIKEKPLTVLQQPEFISMAIEALTQVFGSPHHGNMVVQNFEMSKTLQYAQDSNQIELQTSITKLPGQGGNTTKAMYGISIESIKETVWTTHCEGVIRWDADVSPTLRNDGTITPEVRATAFKPESSLPQDANSTRQMNDSLSKAWLEVGTVV